MNTEPTGSPKSPNNVLPSTIDNPRRESDAAEESKKAQAAGAASKDEFVDGAKHGATAVAEGSRALGNRVTNWFTSSGKKVEQAAQELPADVRHAGERAKSSYAKLVSDMSAASQAGIAGGSYTRSTPANPTVGERIAGAIRAPFSGTAYIYNHAASNPMHGAREASWHTRLSNVTVTAGAAACVWAASFIGAGAAPRLAGWLIKPAPYTAGIASIPNLSALAFYGSAAVLSAAVLVRVGVAVYDKFFDEGRTAPATAPATDPAIN